MKRILTLAIAVILVVAFAIPTFAAPKIELVGARAYVSYTWNGTTPYGTQAANATFDRVKFRLTADNFTFNVMAFAGLTGFDIRDWNFALTLPFMGLTGKYNTGLATYGEHLGRELKIASDTKFQELAGFNWSVALNDDAKTGAFGSLHAKVGVPVGDFTGALEYVRDVPAADNYAFLDLGYNFTEELSVNATIAKMITSNFDDFAFEATVAFPIVDGFTGTFWAAYGMVNFGGTNERYWLFGDLFETTLDLRYNNEKTNGQFLVDYYTDSTFTGGVITVVGEYLSQGNISWDGNLYHNYGDAYWNLHWGYFYTWVRGNNGNEFGARVYADYDLGTTDIGTTTHLMFAPDVLPVVISARGKVDFVWDSVASEYVLGYSIYNWIGVRLTPEIHFALQNRYEDVAGTMTYNLDGALVYYKDRVTAALDLTNLMTTWGASLYVGISF